VIDSIIHGLHQITLDGSAVIFRPKGAFNMGGVKEYEKKFAQLAQPFLGKP
jgi:hypothetical protein